MNRTIEYTDNELSNLEIEEKLKEIKCIKKELEYIVSKEYYYRRLLSNRKEAEDIAKKVDSNELELVNRNYASNSEWITFKFKNRPSFVFFDCGDGGYETIGIDIRYGDEKDTMYKVDDYPIVNYHDHSYMDLNAMARFLPIEWDIAKITEFVERMFPFTKSIKRSVWRLE